MQYNRHFLYKDLFYQLYNINQGNTQLYNQKHSPILVQKFADGEMLFSIGYFYTARNFTDMTDGFAPLPYPKYDVDQKEYYSYVHNIAAGDRRSDPLPFGA